jgi:hypothetical protein
MYLRCQITLLTFVIGLTLVACDENGGDETVDASQIIDAEPGNRAQAAPDKKTETNEKEPTRTEATSKSAGTVEQTPPLPVDDYFKAADVKSLAKADLQTETLAGQAPSETYNSLRIHPSGRNDYGAAVQLWKLDDPKSAAERVSQMRSQYLSVKDPAPDAPVKARDAFLSERQNLWQYVFNPKGAPYVAAVSCSEKFCRDAKIVYEIGSKVNNRILEGDPKKDAPGTSDGADKPAKKAEKPGK